MSASDSERTEEEMAQAESEGEAGRGHQARLPRRPSAFAAKAILEAEECKRTAMTVLMAGGFECARVGLDRAWPECTGGHRPSLAEQLDAERRRTIRQQMLPARRDLAASTATAEVPTTSRTPRTPIADRDTRSIVAEMHERATAVAAGIPELPLPRVDGVPDDVVLKTYTKYEGAKKYREACGLCNSCARNEVSSQATGARGGGGGGGKRRKTTRRPCLTITAVESYENSMGYLNGVDMLRIVETMQRGGAGATGRGVRCGKCRQCLGFKNQGKRRAKCFAVAAVGDAAVPPRLLPVVKLAAAEAEDRMLLSYPYMKQVDTLRLTGIEWLLKNHEDERNGLRRRRRGRDEEDVEADVVIEAEEAARWGAPNVPCATRPGRKRQRKELHAFDGSSDVEVGKVLQSSAFGEAVAAFDEALLGAIRERQALTHRGRIVAGGDRAADGGRCGGRDESEQRNCQGEHHWEQEDHVELDVARSVRAVREPLYRLVEGTLNEAAINLARKAIPTQFRNKNSGDKRIVRERTDVASFPSLPHSALDWYARLLDPSSEAATAAPEPARDVPPGHQQEDDDNDHHDTDDGGQAYRQAMDELIELLPPDVRLPFLASSLSKSGTVALRRFLLRSRH
jgi:hypothetical protein